MKRFLIATALLGALSLSSKPMTTEPTFKGEAQVAMQEAKTMLGKVPAFFNYFPEASIPGAWKEFRDLQLSPNTAIPGKYKELIGSAVSAQIPCHYCSYFHNKASVALYNGTTAEVQEAIAIAASTRQWSTIFNGHNLDEVAFRKDVDKIFKNTKVKTSTMAEMKVNDANQTYLQIQSTFGFVPDFFRKIPQASVSGAWEHLMALEMKDTAIPAKYKSLISLGVAAQTPCSYCVYWDTKTAMSHGATQQEISEAISLAGITRHWSTVLNGNLVNESQFQKDTDFMINYVKKNMKTQPKTLGEIENQETPVRNTATEDAR